MKTLPGATAAQNKLFARYRKSASRRGLAFNLSWAEFVSLTSRPCHYCGRPPSQVSRNSGSPVPFIYNGIDRMSNNAGYSAENCVPCCRACNTAKAKRTYLEFVSQCWKVAMRSVGVAQ